MLIIKRSHDHRIFSLEIPLPGKDGLYNEAGSCFPGDFSGIENDISVIKPQRPKTWIVNSSSLKIY